MTGTPDLEIFFRRVMDLTTEERTQLDEVDHLAFSEVIDASADGMEWVTPELHFLGKLDGKVVSNVGLITRSILVAGKVVIIGGIGGVATHPKLQRQGYARQLMDEAGRYMLKHSEYEFGMLFCDIIRVPYYRQCGYRVIDNPIFITPKGIRQPFHDTCMVLELRGKPFPHGEVDCQGLPW